MKLILFSAGATVNVQAYNNDSYYAQCQNGLNKSDKSNIITFTVSSLSSCNNGNSFDVTTAVYSSGSVSFSFNASNLSNTNWTILNGSTVIKTGNVTPSSNTPTVSSGTLLAGNYIFKLDGISCSGTAQKAFVVSGSSTAPTVVCSPLSPVTGDNIILTASGCVGNYNWFVSNATTPYVTNNGTSSVSSVQGGSYYYATCQGTTNPSNYINIGSLATGGTDATGQSYFTNATKNAPIETELGKYNPDAFPTIAVVNSTDPKLNKTYPNWAIGWKVEGGNFSRSNTNKKTQNVGIPFMYDINNTAYYGYGVRGVDFVLTQDTNNGCPWGQTRDGSNNCVGTATDIDPSLTGSQYNAAFGNLAHTYQNFQSILPFELKAGGNYGIAQDAERNRWLNATLESGVHFDDGQQGGTPTFGQFQV